MAASNDASIVLVSLPAIFRGIRVNPLTTSDTGYLPWMPVGYLVVTAVLVVTFGRIGDMVGRVRMCNLGFAIFTAGSLAASLTYLGGSSGAWRSASTRWPASPDRSSPWWPAASSPGSIGT